MIFDDIQKDIALMLRLQQKIDDYTYKIAYNSLSPTKRAQEDFAGNQFMLNRLKARYGVNE